MYNWDFFVFSPKYSGVEIFKTLSWSIFDQIWGRAWLWVDYKIVLILIDTSTIETHWRIPRRVDGGSWPRTELCTSFAIKLYKSARSADFFLPTKRNLNLRNKNKNFVMEQKCNTKRLYNAPHNYLTRLINDNTQKIRKWKYHTHSML